MKVLLYLPLEWPQIIKGNHYHDYWKSLKPDFQIVFQSYAPIKGV